jgi:glutaryl-CoA dehydrogenase
MQKLEISDFINLDDSLTRREKKLRQMVQSFVAQEVMSIIEDHYEKGTFPLEIIPKLAELGLLGMNIQGYGCKGVNSVQYGLACQALEHGDSGLRSFISVQSSLVMYPIFRFGSEEQKRKWLPEMAKGHKIGCFGMTEPLAGSDPASMKTWATKDGGDWIINGSKLWITNGSIADVALIWANTEEGLRGFLVEKGLPGFSTHLMEKKASLRASVTSSLHLNNVRVPNSAMLPEAKGIQAALSCLSEARLGITWGAIGAALACYEIALDYSKKRIQFGKPIASFQLTQQKLVNMLTEITKGQLLALHISRLKDEGKVNYRQISMGKMNNVAEALKIARSARSILGANGINLHFHVIRHMCNLESLYTYEGTHEMHTLVLGRAITGHQAFF